jgi:hypothetical protein
MFLRFSNLCLLCSLLLAVGCASSHGFSRTRYRIVSVKSSSLLLPPLTGLSRKGERLVFRVNRTMSLSEKPPSFSHCVISARPFELALRNRRWELLMPTLDSWPEPLSMKGSPPEGEPTATGAFENISELARRGCLAEADTVPLKRTVRESLPAPPVDSARYLSGVYLEEGSIDLLPGMRLRIGTAHFANNSTSPKDYIGSTGTTLDVLQDEKGNVIFKHRETSGKEYSKEQATEHSELLQAPALPHYRLLWLTIFVRTEMRRAAVVLGGADAASLGRTAETIAGETGAPCNSIVRKNESVFCKAFAASTSVSAQIPVFLNRTRRYILAASSIRNLFALTKPDDGDTFLKRLRLFRKYSGKYFPIDFRAAETAVWDLTLVPEDRVEWLQGTASLKIL